MSLCEIKAVKDPYYQRNSQNGVQQWKSGSFYPKSRSKKGWNPRRIDQRNGKLTDKNGIMAGISDGFDGRMHGKVP